MNVLYAIFDQNSHTFYSGYGPTLGEPIFGGYPTKGGQISFFPCYDSAKDEAETIMIYKHDLDLKVVQFMTNMV